MPKLISIGPFSGSTALGDMNDLKALATVISELSNSNLSTYGNKLTK